MAHYYFHIEDGAAEAAPDLVECRNVEHARSEAAHLLGDLVKHERNVLWDNGGWRLIVKDDEDLTLFEILIVSTDAAATAQKVQPGR